MKKYAFSLLITIILIENSFTQTPSNSLIPFKNIPEEYKDEANKLLSEMCEGAGLYTLLGDFKPISTLNIKSLSVDITSAEVIDKDGNLVTTDLLFVPQTKEEAENHKKNVLEKVNYYSKLLEAMSNGVFYFQFMPLQDVSEKSLSNPESVGIVGMPEILTLRKDLTLKTIKEKKEFFNSINVDTTDYIKQLHKLLFSEYHSDKSELSQNDYDHANGYLYGYPDYAVDFFANSFAVRDTKRSFINIPIYGKESNYAYAIPYGSIKEEDKILKEKAD